MPKGTENVLGLWEEEKGRLRAFWRTLSDRVYRAVVFGVWFTLTSNGLHPDDIR